MTSADDELLTQTQTVERAQGTAPLRIGRLSVVHPPALAGIVTLPERGTVVIGRRPGDDGYVVVHPTVSREHLALAWSPTLGRWTARDCGSRNGTWVEGERLATEPRALRDGDVLRFGDVLAVHELAPGDDDDDDAVSRAAVPGVSLAAMRLRRAIGAAARDPAPALVIGETGSGKELVSTELHRLSGRSGPLVPFNCAELNPTVVESQLFGHEKGAFTGASAAAAGLFRAAHGGTLFLDEIGELPLELQPKLLRAIQTGEIMPVGGTKTTRVDVRIVGATNRDLETEVRDGRFRRDLFARLAIHVVRVPPLRARRADLFAWVEILGRAWADARGQSVPVLRFAADAAELMLRHAWPENLRGLDRLIHAVAPVAGDPVLAPSHLPTWLTDGAVAIANEQSSDPAPQPAAPEAVERRPMPDRDALMAALEAHQWVVQDVAKYFGRDRRQVYRWMDTHGIRRRD